MGTPVPRLPVTRAQYEAGLKEGRDLYQEDLDRLARSQRRVRIAVIALMVFAFAIASIIAFMLVMW